MKALTFSVLVLTALAVLGYAAAHEGADGKMGGGTMGRGMMGSGMAGMMEGCRDMMQGGMGSGQPNAQWGDRARRAPPAKTEKPQ